jgi:hypothetical protein
MAKLTSIDIAMQFTFNLGHKALSFAYNRAYIIVKYHPSAGDALRPPGGALSREELLKIRAGRKQTSDNLVCA